MLIKAFRVTLKKISRTPLSKKNPHVHDYFWTAYAVAVDIDRGDCNTFSQLTATADADLQPLNY